MNLVPAIRQMEKQIDENNQEHHKKNQELLDGLVALRKLNTVCEECGGKGKRLRQPVCAEDDRPDPNYSGDWRSCEACGGLGVARYD